jgi:hypothetical protein
VSNDGEVADQFHGALATCRASILLPHTMCDSASPLGRR